MLYLSLPPHCVMPKNCLMFSLTATVKSPPALFLYTDGGTRSQIDVCISAAFAYCVVSTT